MPLLSGTNLDQIFCIKQERKVNNDNTIYYKKKILQLPPSTLHYSFAHCKVTVYEHLDETISVGYGPHTIAHFSSSGELIETLELPKRIQVE